MLQVKLTPREKIIFTLNIEFLIRNMALLRVFLTLEEV